MESAFRPFLPVDEQLDLLTRGAVDLTTAEDLKRKLARSNATKPSCSRPRATNANP